MVAIIEKMCIKYLAPRALNKSVIFLYFFVFRIEKHQIILFHESVTEVLVSASSLNSRVNFDGSFLS